MDAALGARDGVDLVDDDEIEMLKDAAPAGVVGQDARVEHIGIGEDDVSGGADRLARGSRRVAIEGEKLHPGLRGAGQLFEFDVLILRERLRRIEIDRTTIGVLEQALQHGQIEAQRLARRCGSDDDDIAASAHSIKGGGLVRIEALDTALAQGTDQPRIERRRKIGIIASPRGHVFDVGDVAGDVTRRQQLFDDGVQIGPARRV